MKAKGTKTTVVEERFVVNKLDEQNGLRIITAGGVSSGIDAALWLVGELVGKESKEKVEFIVQHAHRTGIVM